MLQEFKKIAMRGNVLNLAIAHLAYPLVGSPLT